MNKTGNAFNVKNPGRMAGVLFVVQHISRSIPKALAYFHRLEGAPSERMRLGIEDVFIQVEGAVAL